MPVRIVQSHDNRRLKELRRALAQPGRDAAGLLAIEGPHLVAEALRAGLRFACVFVAQGSDRLLAGLDLPAEVEILSLPPALLHRALATETPQPIAALVAPPAWTWENLFADGAQNAPLFVILAGLQDPGNLGTIVRAAEAFGACGVISLPGTASAWNGKALRASAGSLFRVPLLSAHARDAMERLHECGVKIYATTARAARPASLVNLTGPVALVIGNEGSGVPRDLVDAADGAMTIPCPGPVESLNAAVAAGVLLYEAARQRGARHHARGEPA